LNKVFSNWQALVWAHRGAGFPLRPVSDVVFASSSGPMMFHRMWAKNVTPIIHWLSRFSEGGYSVFDPFTGGGTVPAVCKMLGRNWIAFEIDPATAEKARERVALTQVPLWVPEPVQDALPLEAA
jgi:hypothetical protein